MSWVYVAVSIFVCQVGWCFQVVAEVTGEVVHSSIDRCTQSDALVSPVYRLTVLISLPRNCRRSNVKNDRYTPVRPFSARILPTGASPASLR